MIIVAIIALSGVVLVALYAALVGFPSMPDAVWTTWDYMSPYFSSGFSLLYAFCYRSLIVNLFRVTVTVEGIVLGYKFIMWVAKKIPMFGVSD